LRSKVISRTVTFLRIRDQIPNAPAKGMFADRGMLTGIPVSSLRNSCTLLAVARQLDRAGAHHTLRGA
jgi:hypothetical protein